MQSTPYKSICIAIIFILAGHGLLTAQADFADTVRLQEIIVTGTPVRVTRNNVPLAVSVVDRSQIEDTGESALLPVLSGRVPGLFVTERGITGFGVATGSAGQITIRGIGGNPTTGVLMLIDGHPQFMGIMGHPLPDSYVASDAERVEVIRGPASILYGSNAMGGVINIITKKQLTEGFRGNARLSYGSFNTQKYMASGGVRKNKISVFVSGNRDQTDGHRENSDFKINNGYIKLGWEPNGNFYAATDFSLAGFRASDPGPDTLNARAGEKIDILRGYWAFTLRHELRKLDGSVKVFTNFGEHDITDGFHSKDRSAGINIFESFKPSDRTSLTLGLDYVSYGGMAENLKAMGGKGIVFTDTTVRETGLYAFAQHTMFKILTLNAGLRYQNHSIYTNIWIPSGGFACRITDKTTWKGAVSKGFRSPTIRELFLWGPNPNLAPEKIINYETGLGYAPGRQINLELTAFLVNGDNLIVNVPMKGLLNSGKVNNKGIEFSADARIDKNLNLNFTYSFTDMKVPVFATPEHHLFAGLRYRHKKFLLSGNAQQVVNLDTDPSSAVSKESYLNLGGKVTYQFSKRLALFLSGDNLLDQDYEVNRYYSMPGISLFAGLNLGI